MYSKFNGLNNDAFLSVWEAFPFSIQAYRNQTTNAISLKNPPGDPPSFEGRLRDVSVTFRSSNDAFPNIQYLIYLGKQSQVLNDRKDGRQMLLSHYTLYSLKPDSFWAKEFNEIGEANCIYKDGSEHFVGCLNSPDEADISLINLSFSVGHASFPHGKYADGIISVTLNNFNHNWEPKLDLDSPHQNFVLLILRMHDKLLCFL